MGVILNFILFNEAAWLENTNEDDVFTFDALDFNHTTSESLMSLMAEL